MSKEDGIEVMATVVDTFPGDLFKVEVENKHQVVAYRCGKMRVNGIRLGRGDRVTVSLSPYDLTRGRIVYRHR